MSETARELEAAGLGTAKGAEELLPLVYAELRKLAAQKLANEAPGHTLQPTALVHEAWLRLAGSGEDKWNSQGHFFAAAAEAMRRILVENVRRKKREKHGGQLQRVALEGLRVGVDCAPDELLILDEMLEELGQSDVQTAELVKLHCFAGLSIEQAADLLGISPRTAYRDWAYARAWLFRRIERRAQDSAD